MRRGVKIDDTNSFNELKHTISEGYIDLLMLDSLTRIHDSDENLANEIAKIFNRIASLSSQYGVTVIVNHHSTKTTQFSTVSPRGSSDIRNVADCVLQMSGIGEIKKIVHDKPRYSAKLPPFRISLKKIKGLTPTSFEYIDELEQYGQIKKVQRMGQKKRLSNY